MNDPGRTTEDPRAGGQAGKPVAEFWYAIQPQDDGIIRFSEIYVDPYAVGDIWLVRGSERDLAVDTGSGIEPDVLARIFDVYYSTKRRGTGLGLPTSRRFIEEHDGTIDVQSDVGHGTAVEVVLPVEGPSETSVSDTDDLAERRDG